MGLDISFDRKAALKAGIEVKLDTNGSTEDIVFALQAEEPDLEYIEWLEQVVTLVRVPGRDYWVHDGGGTDNICVRANKWGDTYAPLTQWLQRHNILWDEF